MEIKCDRCGYVASSRWVMTRHLNRKIACTPTLSDASIDELKSNIERTYKDDHYSCGFCAKKFNTYQSMYRHKKTCKENKETLKISKTEFDILVEKVNELEKVKHINNINNGTINNNNNITVNQTIHIHDFGKETVGHLPKDFLTHCFMMQDIPGLIENIFFDRECPENHNVKLKSIKNKLIQVYQDNKWVTKQSDDVLNQLVDKGSPLLQKHYRKNTTDIEGDMTEDEINEVLDWLCQIVRENEKIRKPIKETLLAMMDNYRNQLCVK